MNVKLRILIAVLVLGISNGASAQATNAAQPAAWSLFTARYDTRTSDFIYALYGYGANFGMVGALHNPRTDWSELLGAVGRMFSAGDAGSYAIATGLAQTSGQWYAQAYAVPSLRAGPVMVRATSELDVPISKSSVLQFGLSPLALTIPMMRSIELGVAADLAAARDAHTSAAVGPELRIALPHAVIGVDAERYTTERGGRFRVFFTSQF